jgi:hypothetical protein
MANKILITPLFENVSSSLDEEGGVVSTITKEDVMVFPLTEDISFEVESTMASWSDIVPGLNILGMFQMVSTGVSGGASEGILNMQNLFDAPRWEKTSPISFSASLGFYTVEDAYKDVYLPMKTLIGYSILSKRKIAGETKIVPPGIYLPSASATQEGTSAESLNGSAKLISVKIPGIIFMELAMITSCSPTFSKHITDKGYPLWGTLELSITGLKQAFDSDFNGEDTVSQL